MEKTKHDDIPESQQITMRADIFNDGAHMHLQTQDGQFIGTVTYKVANHIHTAALVQAFVNLVQQLAKRVQPVSLNGAAPPAKLNGG